MAKATYTIPATTIVALETERLMALGDVSAHAPGGGQNKAKVF